MTDTTGKLGRARLGALKLADNAGIADSGTPFIGSVSAVYTPTLANLEVDPSFIASTTSVFAPTVSHPPRVEASITPSLLDSLHTASAAAWTVTVPNDGSVIEGDVLVVAVSAQLTTIATPTGWTRDVNALNSGGSQNLYVFRKTATHADLGTTVTFTAGAATRMDGAFIGLRDADVLDTSATNAVSANPISVTLGATSDDQELVLFVVMTDGTNITGAGWSTPSGFTQLVQTAGGGAVTPNLGVFTRSYPTGGTSVGSVSSTNTGSGSPNSAAGLVIKAASFPFIGSRTRVNLTLLSTEIDLPFIASVTVLHTETLTHAEVDVPFIGSVTIVHGVFSLFRDTTASGIPGNSGETFDVRLAPNGTSVTATLAASIGSAATLLELTGGGSLPATQPFCLTIDSEVLYVVAIGGGAYRIRRRGVSNTTPTAHTAGASTTWSDSYDLELVATDDIALQFTANITSSGTFTYPGWLICFDATQAYLAGARYPMHVTELLGVFDAGAGSSGTNRCDATQPNAIATPTGTSDDCPAALSNPSRIQADILAGDVALVRYTNPEASPLDLGQRAVALQSWFGLKRVDASDVDVTLTDPTGFVVDGSVNGEWDNPLGPGIGPDTGAPTSHDVPYTSVTLPGSSRTFTHGSPGYNEKGWPICALAVRQGTRRIPFWRSWDWHDYNYVYSGFDTDAVFCQLVINRNGIVFGTTPVDALPGPQDIDGPDAVWDDGSYRFAASWYVAIYAGPYLVLGPSIGGAGAGFGGGGSVGYLPSVDFSGGVTSPVVTVPTVEGGSGGDIGPPSARTLFAAAVV